MSPIERAARAVSYDPSTGRFLSLDGKDLGTSHPKGYVWIRAAGVKVLAHRLAWYVVHGVEPPVTVDHVNRDPADNRIANLRLATRSQNQMNRGPQANSSTGVSGVSQDARKQRWVAYIKVDNVRRHIGVFAKIEDAIAARREAERRLFGEFAPGAV